ncbi:hypothetical protein [Stenotrophomonas sp. SAU14A_NAIMI4_5]|uniref:hypothetical protein n=1 Tax=Stenotrophomonas sp. SAU14A_NAIMI4_5 TaxID=2072413 RepID=UPI001C1FBD64|nr:hypothetical protein [Stenotrophomonas sp. SAU14A_NAIMI4_5]
MDHLEAVGLLTRDRRFNSSTVYNVTPANLDKAAAPSKGSRKAGKSGTASGAGLEVRPVPRNRHITPIEPSDEPPVAPPVATQPTKSELEEQMQVACRATWAAYSLAEARTDLGLAEVCIGWGGAATAEQRANHDAAQQRLGRVKAQCWPISTLESLPTLAMEVISEIAHRPHCASCEGRGETVSGELLMTCKVCGGSGLGQVSDRRRATALGRDEEDYRRSWRPVFEWMLGKMQEAEQDAAWHLGAAIGQAALTPLTTRGCAESPPRPTLLR